MPTQAEQRRLLTVKELADEWRQHPHTIYRKIAAGEIPAVQLGGKGSAIRVDERELEAMLHQDPTVPAVARSVPAEHGETSVVRQSSSPAPAGLEKSR